MALKDLLVYLDQTERASLRLRLSADLARRHSAHLTALYARGWSRAQLARRKSAELGLRSFGELQQLDNRMRAKVDTVAEQLDASLHRLAHEYHLTVTWRELEGSPALVLPQLARCADLCILGEDVPSDSTSIGYAFGEEMLFVTGRPILFIPAVGEFVTLGKHVLIAWNSSRAAAMAVNDALPVIEQAEKVTVLAVNPAAFTTSYGGLPAEQLVAHLERHGARPVCLSLESVPDGAIAAALQAKALELGADLMVAGAYGQPRLREKLLGGVTRDLLASMKLPLLMSH